MVLLDYDKIQNFIKNDAKMDPKIMYKSADPRSGVLEHVERGRFTSPLPPPALGVAAVRPRTPRIVSLKGHKPSDSVA